MTLHDVKNVAASGARKARDRARTLHGVSQNLNTSLVPIPLKPLPDFSVERYVSKTPFFLKVKPLKLPHNHFDIVETVKNFIKVLAPHCERLLQEQKAYLLERTQYLSGWGEVELTNPDLGTGGLVDAERIPPELTARPGATTDSGHWDRAYSANPHTTPVNSRPIFLADVPLSLPPSFLKLWDFVGEDRDLTRFVRDGIARCHLTKLAPNENNFKKVTKPLEIITSKEQSTVDPTFPAARQNLRLFAAGIPTINKFASKFERSCQVLRQTVDEAFQIEHLLAQNGNVFVRRLIMYYTKGLPQQPHLGLAYLFYQGLKASTISKNYGPQIKASIDYCNSVLEKPFKSVAQFVYSLRNEQTRRLVGNQVPRFFCLRAYSKSSHSANNWWSAISYCFKMHAHSLKHYASPVLRRSILRGFVSITNPTEGFFATEWILLIRQGYLSGDLQTVLDTLFLVYMMRLSLRSDTIAKLSNSSPMLIRQGNQKLCDLHQWAIEAKNSQYELGHIPTFSRIKEEPDSPTKPYVCAVWALKMIRQIRHQCDISHTGFLFDTKGNSVSPTVWRNKVTSRLKMFQKQIAPEFPHVKLIRVGGHTPRKTFANIAASFNLTDAEIRMVMRNRSMNVIRRHYLECSRAYKKSKSWNSHLNIVHMASKDVAKGVRHFTTKFDAMSQREWLERQEFPD